MFVWKSSFRLEDASCVAPPHRSPFRSISPAFGGDPVIGTVDAGRIRQDGDDMGIREFGAWSRILVLDTSPSRSCAIHQASSPILCSIA